MIKLTSPFLANCEARIILSGVA